MTNQFRIACLSSLTNWGSPHAGVTSRLSLGIFAFQILKKVLLFLLLSFSLRCNRSSVHFLEFQSYNYSPKSQTWQTHHTAECSSKAPTSLGVWNTNECWLMRRQRSYCKRCTKTQGTRCRGGDSSRHRSHWETALRLGIDSQWWLLSSWRYVLSSLGGVKLPHHHECCCTHRIQ